MVVQSIEEDFFVAIAQAIVVLNIPVLEQILVMLGDGIGYFF